MTRTFIETDEFRRKWKSMGLGEQELSELQGIILLDPQAGSVIQGTGGLRKLRFAFEGRGKRGSARVCYVDFVVKETVYLITAYSKSEKDNLTKAERNNIRKLIEILDRG